METIVYLTKHIDILINSYIKLYQVALTSRYTLKNIQSIKKHNISSGNEHTIFK